MWIDIATDNKNIIEDIRNSGLLEGFSEVKSFEDMENKIEDLGKSSVAEIKIYSFNLIGDLFRYINSFDDDESLKKRGLLFTNYQRLKGIISFDDTVKVVSEVLFESSLSRISSPSFLLFREPMDSGIYLSYLKLFISSKTRRSTVVY